METSTKLTAKQSLALPETLRDLISKDFGTKDIAEYTDPKTQLRNLPPEVRSSGIGIIISRVSILSGFKGEIPEINKEDIAELLMTRFRGISLNELQYAFKIDRYGYHGDPTPHYQIFNAEYVAKVLNKYSGYRQEVRERPNWL